MVAALVCECAAAVAASARSTEFTTGIAPFAGLPLEYLFFVFEVTVALDAGGKLVAKGPPHDGGRANAFSLLGNGIVDLVRRPVSDRQQSVWFC